MCYVTSKKDENGEQILDEYGNPIPIPVMVPVWNEGEEFVLFTDSNGNMKTAEEYVSIGPKDEVFLNNGQSVTFSLKHSDRDSFKIHMGMKAPRGTAKVMVGNTEVTLKNAVDCYYDISKYAVITEAVDADGQPYYVTTFTFTSVDSLVALTNIKVTGNYEFTVLDHVAK